MPLIIFLVECGIELIPKEIRSHSAVRKNLSAQIYSSQLLDNALHHSAMVNLKNSEKRGRPDIAHLSLLNALGSPLNKNGNLRLFLHTIKNKIYEFNPDIRISRNYNRFKGLMAKLLIDNDINVNGTKLISLFNGTIQDLLSTFKDPKILQFSKKGKLIQNYNELFLGDISKNNIAIIGGFQKSTFSDEFLDLSKNLISISNYSLDAWVVVGKVINFYELSHNII
ncbi:MAG: 16S rRNA methyltransferase [Candidatus Lokiarchaeota archaeon]|nr:16S rRNA methyltransferase [Candidatus Lokiarchaeota archaeon]